MAKSEDQILVKVLERISKAPIMKTSTIYHPSECVNKMLDPSLDNEICRSNKKFLDVINCYHIYCRLCKHHYYSCSKLNDINSFFQIHINSVDHIWNQGSCNWDESKPIFQWEKWLNTGFCAVCNKSGIEAFVIDTQKDIVKIIEQHVRKIEHQERYKSINGEQFDAIMAKSDLFSKIYIVKLSKGQYLCKVCGFEIEREALLEHHLNSKQHCQKFCQLLKKELNVKINNRHMKLDEKELAQQMRELPVFKSYSTTIDKKKCNLNERYRSEKSELRYFTQQQLGFSPSAIEKSYSVEEEDLRNAPYCALCQENPMSMNRHLSSNSHQLRVMVFNQCSLVRPVSLVEYVHNCRSSSIKVEEEVKKYMKYKELLQKKGLDFGIPFKPEYANINLNLEKCEDDPSCKAIYNEINCIQRKSSTDKIEPQNLQPNTSKSNETKENEISGPEKMKEKTEDFISDNYSGKKRADKMKLEGIVITTEKLSDKDFSIVRSCIDKYLENAAERSCNLQESSDENEEYDRYQENKATLIRRHHNDPDFIHTFEKWNFLDTSYFVCVVCGSTCRSSDYIFRHMKKKNHIRRYEELKSGKLKRISPLEFSAEKGSYFCKKCRQRICLIESPENFSIPFATRSIKLHDAKCTGAKRFSSAPVVDESIAEFLTAELKRVLMIGEESRGADSTGVVSPRDANHVDAVRESTSKTDIKETENSPSRRTAGRQVENCVGKASRRKVEETTPVYPDKRDKSRGNVEAHKGKTQKEGQKEVEAGAKPGKSKKRNASKSQPTENGSVLKHNLGNFRKLCKSVLTEYLCAICLVNDSINVIEDHLKSETHAVNEAYIRSKWTVQLGFCKFCQLLLLGTSDMFRQHYTSLYHANKERDSSGKESVHESPNSKTMSILVVKGLSNLSREEEERFIRLLLSPFGAIKRIQVKNKWSEVQFFDQRYIPIILAESKSLVKEFPSLSFSLKKVTREPEIAMRSSEIYLLGRGEILLMTFVSRLVEQANDMVLSRHEKKKEDELCDALQRVIGYIFPNCKCYKFGSRVTGLIVGDCDLDVFLDYGDVYYGDGTENPENQSRIVKKVATALETSRQFSHVTGIEHCRVPIVTCLHKSTNIHCDISFKNGLSCENTNLIKFMISIDDRVKEVILFFKYWAKRNDLHGRPYFSSYALTMIVFFYLQQDPNPVLPTVEFLKSCYKEPDKVIGEWDCGFTTDEKLIPKTKNTDSATELILGFFNFCVNFNFSDNVISPLTGKTLSKEIIRNMKKDGLPPPYEKYRSQISVGNYGGRESICIMDPFDLNHNLTKFFPPSSFKRFLYLCRLSANLLSNSLKSKYFSHLYEDPKS